MLKAFFGGGSSYIYLAVAIGAIGFWIHYQDIKSDLAAEKKEVSRLQGVVTSKDAVIAQQAGTAQRRQEEGNEQKGNEDEIRSTEDTKFCQGAPAIRVALGQLRDGRGSAAGDNADE